MCGCTFWLHPAISGFRVRVLILPSPRQSCLGYGVGVLLWVFCLYFTGPGRSSWFVCLGSGLAFTLPISPGVSACACFVCALCLFPANPGWGWRCVFLSRGFAFLLRILAGLLRYVCLCAHSTCTRPILAGSCGACIRVLLLALPRHCWLGAVVCFSRSGFCIYPANHGWGPGVWVSLRAPPVPPWLVSAILCSVAGFGFSPPILVRVCGVCVSGFGVCFHPANPCRGVGVCVLLCALARYPAKHGWSLPDVCLGIIFGFILPFLAWARGVCVWVQALLSPRQSLLGCRCVCVCVWAPPVPRQTWLFSAVCVSGYRFCFYPANPGSNVGVCGFLCALRPYPANPGS